MSSIYKVLTRYYPQLIYVAYKKLMFTEHQSLRWKAKVCTESVQYVLRNKVSSTTLCSECQKPNHSRKGFLSTRKCSEYPEYMKYSETMGGRKCSHRPWYVSEQFGAQNFGNFYFLNYYYILLLYFMFAGTQQTWN